MALTVSPSSRGTRLDGRASTLGGGTPSSPASLTPALREGLGQRDAELGASNSVPGPSTLL